MTTVHPATFAGINSDSEVILATSSGAWRIPKTSIVTSVGLSDPELQPVRVELMQNYPNPFNPSTKISFSIPRSEQVTLVIYDLVGKEVARLVNGENMNAGVHTIEFNASTLASGVYIYRIEAGTFTDSKKMMLIK